MSYYVIGKSGVTKRSSLLFEIEQRQLASCTGNHLKPQEKSLNFQNRSTFSWISTNNVQKTTAESWRSGHHRHKARQSHEFQFTPKMKANAELWCCGVTSSFGVFFHKIKHNGMTSFIKFMKGKYWYSGAQTEYPILLNNNKTKAKAAMGQQQLFELDKWELAAVVTLPGKSAKNSSHLVTSKYTPLSCLHLLRFTHIVRIPIISHHNYASCTVRTESTFFGASACHK